MIHRKSQSDLDRMAAAGAIVAETLALLAESARPGMSTLELDEIAERHIRAAGGVPTFKGYRGFPGSICASPNDMIVHGIPADDVVLADGDIISIDVGVTRQGFVADSAVTVAIGTPPEPALELMRVCQASLFAAVEACQPGCRLGDIGAAVQGVVEGAGFAVVRDLVGHGVGRAMHEDPQVPNYCSPAFRRNYDFELETGLVIAVEPMVNMGTKKVRLMPDHWTQSTVDGLPSAHFEHTIAITEEGPEVLTRGPDAGESAPV